MVFRSKERPDMRLIGDENAFAGIDAQQSTDASLSADALRPAGYTNIEAPPSAASKVPLRSAVIAGEEVSVLSEMPISDSPKTDEAPPVGWIFRQGDKRTARKVDDSLFRDAAEGDHDARLQVDARTNQLREDVAKLHVQDPESVGTKRARSRFEEHLRRLDSARTALLKRQGVDEETIIAQTIEAQAKQAGLLGTRVAKLQDEHSSLDNFLPRVPRVSLRQRLARIVSGGDVERRVMQDDQDLSVDHDELVHARAAQRQRPLAPEPARQTAASTPSAVKMSPAINDLTQRNLEQRRLAAIKMEELRDAYIASIGTDQAEARHADYNNFFTRVVDAEKTMLKNMNTWDLEHGVRSLEEPQLSLKDQLTLTESNLYNNELRDYLAREEAHAKVASGDYQFAEDGSVVPVNDSQNWLRHVATGLAGVFKSQHRYTMTDSTDERNKEFLNDKQMEPAPAPALPSPNEFKQKLRSIIPERNSDAQLSEPEKAGKRSLISKKLGALASAASDIPLNIHKSLTARFMKERPEDVDEEAEREAFIARNERRRKMSLLIHAGALAYVVTKTVQNVHGIDIHLPFIDDIAAHNPFGNNHESHKLAFEQSDKNDGSRVDRGGDGDGQGGGRGDQSGNDDPTGPDIHDTPNRVVFEQGDNPWDVASSSLHYDASNEDIDRVKDEILRLNNLSEQQATQLPVGYRLQMPVELIEELNKKHK